MNQHHQAIILEDLLRECIFSFGLPYGPQDKGKKVDEYNLGEKDVLSSLPEFDKTPLQGMLTNFDTNEKYQSIIFEGIGQISLCARSNGQKSYQLFEYNLFRKCQILRNRLELNIPNYSAMQGA